MKIGEDTLRIVVASECSSGIEIDTKEVVDILGIGKKQKLTVTRYSDTNVWDIRPVSKMRYKLKRKALYEYFENLKEEGKIKGYYKDIILAARVDERSWEAWFDLIGD